METEEKSIRALKCEQSVLSRADGSVMFSQGIEIFLTFLCCFRSVILSNLTSVFYHFREHGGNGFSVWAIGGENTKRTV